MKKIRFHFYDHLYGNCDNARSGVEKKAQELRHFHDEAALHALEGMLAHARHGHGYRPRLEDAHLHWHDAIAKEAFELADAMTRERERSEQWVLGQARADVVAHGWTPRGKGGDEGE